MTIPSYASIRSLRHEWAHEGRHSVYLSSAVAAHPELVLGKADKTRSSAYFGEQPGCVAHWAELSEEHGAALPKQAVQEQPAPSHVKLDLFVSQAAGDPAHALPFQLQPATLVQVAGVTRVLQADGVPLQDGVQVQPESLHAVLPTNPEQDLGVPLQDVVNTQPEILAQSVALAALAHDLGVPEHASVGMQPVAVLHCTAVRSAQSVAVPLQFVAAPAAPAVPAEPPAAPAVPPVFAPPLVVEPPWLVAPAWPADSVCPPTLLSPAVAPPPAPAPAAAVASPASPPAPEPPALPPTPPLDPQSTTAPRAIGTSTNQGNLRMPREWAEFR